MTTQMKCHYEILGVGRDAGDDELKKSYRKLALKWHPDKNQGKEEECAAHFRIIQQAYDVLSDPQERAWYDKHREAILRGGMGQGDKYEDNCLDVYHYFNTSCFSGYGDDEKGFYTVYRHVFEEIVDQDREFVDDDDWDEPPGFGDSESLYDDVVGVFYGYWMSYYTKKSYVWVEEYDTRHAPDRRTRRMAEAENKKFRDKAKKERNEEVRALVAFVRKRDKRVQAHRKHLEEKAEESKRMAEEKRQKDKLERLKELENYKEMEWAALSEQSLEKLEAEYDSDTDEETGDTDDEEEEEYFDDLYCVSCNKPFKTEKALTNHKRSKKHKENEALLRAHMMEEDAQLLGEGGLEENLEEEEEIQEEVAPKQKLSKKQKKKRKQQQALLKQEEEELAEDMQDMDINKDENDGETTSTSQQQNDSSSQPGAGDEGELEKSAMIPEAPQSETTDETAADQTVADQATETQSESTTKSKSKKKKGKKSNQPEQENKPQQSQTVCNICAEEFGTRNKLFSHIKESGHAILLPKGATPLSHSASASGGKKKKKGKK